MEKKNKRLKLGFIGGAINSAVGYAHFSACLMDNKFSLCAGCFSRNEELSKQTAEIYGVSPDRVYTDYKKMLKKEKDKLDAIVVLTPTPAHFEVVYECLKNDIPVICEKALVCESSEAKTLKNLVKEKKGFLVLTYNYTGYPMLRELRKMIEEERLGKILHFQALMPQEGFIRVNQFGEKPTPQQWRLSDRKNPTIYLDLAVHLHEILNYILSEKPVAVSVDQASDGWFDIIDNVNCLCRYSNGIQGHIWFSKSALGQRNGLEIHIYGTEASAKWVQVNPEELIISRKDGSKMFYDRAANVKVADAIRYTRFKAGHPAGFIEAFANLYTDIAEALHEYKETGKWASKEIFGPELALEGLEFIESMVESSKTKKWENVIYS